MTDVFISYSNKDGQFVQRLVKDLEAAGIDVFYDQRIKGGDSWVSSLSEAIESARFVLVVLSPDAISSEWIRQEVGVGLVRESQGRSKVIPLLLRDCEPQALLMHKTYVDFRQDYDDGLRLLLQVLQGSLPDDTAREVPGNQAGDMDATEISRLRNELEAAVALFKAKPQPPASQPGAQPAARGRRKCFVVMPFGKDDLQVVYEDFVKPFLESGCDLDCQRGDDVFGSSVVMDDIRHSIDDADIIVADLTGKNANVFYEVGICHALDKPVLLMAQSIDDVPFDLRHRRVLLYEYSPRGCKRLEKMLGENLRAMLDKLV